MYRRNSVGTMIGQISQGIHAGPPVPWPSILGHCAHREAECKNHRIPHGRSCTRWSNFEDVWWGQDPSKLYYFYSRCHWQCRSSICSICEPHFLCLLRPTRTVETKSWLWRSNDKDYADSKSLSGVGPAYLSGVWSFEYQLEWVAFPHGRTSGIATHFLWFVSRPLLIP